MAGIRWRAVVDNDFAGDPDGLVSLAHVLLTEDVRVELITSTPVDPRLADVAGMDGSTSASLGIERARQLLDLLGRTGVDVIAGAETFAPGGDPSPAARAIAEACLVDSDVPLAILCGGPLTNVAAAIALEPSIRTRAVLVWIGGSVHEAPEYNLDTDAAAAASVRGSGISMVEIPLETYERMRVSVAEVSHELATASPVGAWLADRLLDLPPFVTLHGVLTLGDSALAAAVGLDPTFRPSPAGGPARRIADVDMRLLWGDLLAKLRRANARSDPR
jgi:purine nucleosidase